MDSVENEKEMVITQVSLGGFGNDVSAKELTEFLEDNIGLLWRCRLKTSWTPIESYPEFEISDTNEVQKTDDYQKVAPHAFVHFVSPGSVTDVKNASVKCELFLGNQALKISLGPENPFRINQRRRTTTPYKFTNVGVQVGVLVTRDDFCFAWNNGPGTLVDFLVDPFDKTCKFLFTKDTAFSFKNAVKHAVIRCDYKMEFSVRDIFEVKEGRDSSSLIILLQLASSPLVYYRTADDDINETVSFDLLDDDDPWIRTTDFTPSGALGKCNYYRISISPRHGLKLEKTMDYFRTQRVSVGPIRQRLSIREEPDFGARMSDPFFCIQYKEGIPFEILFLLNAVLHKGIINQHQICDNFYDLLKSQPKEISVAALKHMCSYKHPLFDAYKRLKVVQSWLLKNPKLLKSTDQLGDISEVRRLIITPSKAYCVPPEVELSNRVLRKYKEVADRFLRVTFMDEGMRTINANVLNYYASPIVRDIMSNSFAQKTRIFKRVRSILFDGFYLCGRKYSFLAFSSNQLRDRSAWFFAEDGKLTVDTIKSWMGKFTNKNIAKCSARMGQCFSSTYATVEVPDYEVEEIPNIKRNGYDFSDGIGKITPDLAKEVAEILKLGFDPPCAYQIRYAGCKGVVVSWPKEDDGIRLSLRPSMNKFQSRHTMLEICSWTRFQPGFLNRQIITLLSTLGVCDEIFWKMQQTMISKLNQMLTDTDAAFDVLTGSCAEQGNTAAIMLSAGFKPNIEPHLRGMLTCIRAAQLSGLREKARIFVPSGRWLMGCLDEAGVLEQGQCFVQVSSPLVENCFYTHGSKFTDKKKNLEVVKGFVAIGKNPCLHPGDIRILEAVDNPCLHHLIDCVIFPQKGERPHTNEASGSDLDGDLYFVSWDGDLLPPSKKSWVPMQYDSAEAKLLPRPVNRTDIIDFFVKNMVNENLGAICNAHVVHADCSDVGALDEKCITLAELAATAVDFPKTGKIVTMPASLKPKLYPDFMGKEAFQTYKSKKILGKLYRQIVDVYDEDLSKPSEIAFGPKDIVYDTDLKVSGCEDFIADAWNQKCCYDGQLNGLLGQYKVNREEEVVTGHVWTMPKYTSKKQGELKERLKHAYNALKSDFRKVFEKLDLDFNQLSDDEKNKMYEKKASAWYQVTYHSSWVEKAMELQELDDGGGEKVMLSFAWIAADYLARIKIKHKGLGTTDATKPVYSLAKYIADRI